VIAYPHLVRIEIVMCYLSLVQVLESCSKGCHRRDNRQQGKLPSLRVILTQRPKRGKVHDQKRKVVLYSPIAKRQQIDVSQNTFRFSLR
jgi:hypothetical protein